jgi:hypothetical protein
MIDRENELSAGEYRLRSGRCFFRGVIACALSFAFGKAGETASGLSTPACFLAGGLLALIAMALFVSWNGYRTKYLSASRRS